MNDYLDLSFFRRTMMLKNPIDVKPFIGLIAVLERRERRKLEIKAVALSVSLFLVIITIMLLVP